MTPTLYHFTCSHTYRKVGGKGVLVPGWMLWDETRRRAVPANAQVVVDIIGGWIWATTDENGRGCGLEPGNLKCDRLARRYRIITPDTFLAWASARSKYPDDVVKEFERDVDPSTWWVSAAPAAVVYDPVKVTT